MCYQKNEKSEQGAEAELREMDVSVCELRTDAGVCVSGSLLR